MKTINKIFLAIFILCILCAEINAQENKVNVDCLKLGEVYSVTEKNGLETEGRLFKIDTASIEIRTDRKVISIEKSQIIAVKGVFNEAGVRIKKTGNDSVIKGKVIDEKIYLSVGVGGGLPSLWGYYSYNSGVNFQFNVMKVMSYTHAIRGDFQFTHYSSANSEYYQVYEGGHLNTYGMKMNFLLGDFKKKSIVMGYGILGGGVNISKRSATKYSYPEYDPVTMSNTGRSYTYTKEYDADSFMNIDCGWGLNYKISDKVKLYGEAQYTFPLVYLGEYGGFNPYGFLLGAPSIRLGAQIGF